MDSVVFSATGKMPSRPICIKFAAKVPGWTRLYFERSEFSRLATVETKALLTLTPSTLSRDTFPPRASTTSNKSPNITRGATSISFNNSEFTELLEGMLERFLQCSIKGRISLHSATQACAASSSDFSNTSFSSMSAVSPLYTSTYALCTSIGGKGIFTRHISSQLKNSVALPQEFVTTYLLKSSLQKIVMSKGLPHPLS